jgi:hypothetical protein
MELHFINPRKNALPTWQDPLRLPDPVVRTARAGIEEPYWAMISLIIVTEPDMTVAKANFRARLINTISGCIVSCIALVMFGPTFLAMLVALTAAVCRGHAAAELSQQLAAGTGHRGDPAVGRLHRQWPEPGTAPGLDAGGSHRRKYGGIVADGDLHVVAEGAQTGSGKLEQPAPGLCRLQGCC